jgi:hypothetical protein
LKKIKKEPTPDIYKIVYRLSRWKTKSSRYYTAFSCDEALDDFHYAFEQNMANSNRLTILSIMFYDRFADKWLDRTSDINTLPNFASINKKNQIVFNITA